MPEVQVMPTTLFMLFFAGMLVGYNLRIKRKRNVNQ
jgi:hypothetical protein